jgi:hypothetical protein
MSTRFEKKIIMPKGKMGRTTLMDLSKEDRQSVERWHRKEWHQFIEEAVAYKHRVLGAARDAYLWNREKCIACKKVRSIANTMRKFKSRYHQRGSVTLGAAGISTFSQHSAGGDCSFTASTVPNLSDFVIEPANAYTRARLHSDGDWYWSEANTWSTSKGTWDGDCAIADYDTRWNRVSGTVPNDVVSGTDGVWSAATTSKAVGYNSNFGIDSGSFSLECRDGTTLTLLFTDSFTMSAEVDSKN